MLKNTQTDTECLTVCGPCKPFISFSAVTGPSHQSELYENNLPSTAVGFNKNWSSMINVKGRLDTKICAFRSRRSHASRPSGAGKVHAQHTFIRAHICTHRHARSHRRSTEYGEYQMLFVQHVLLLSNVRTFFCTKYKYTYNSCILFFYDFQRDVVDLAHCKRQLQRIFICK